MKKLRLVLICLFVPLFILTAVISLKIRHKVELLKRGEMMLKIRKVLTPLLSDLRVVHESSIQDVPADGRWYDRITFSGLRQGILEYSAQEGRVWRTGNGKRILIADDIDGWHLRRQMKTPEILEIRIDTQKDDPLSLNLRARIPQ